jgi:hypothetical protein
MSSLLKERPGIRPRFFSQKMLQKLPLKKMPSTAAKAMRRSAKLPRLIQRRAHSAFFCTQGTVSMACSRWCFSVGSLIRVSISRL